MYIQEVKRKAKIHFNKGEDKKNICFEACKSIYLFAT